MTRPDLTTWLATRTPAQIRTAIGQTLGVLGLLALLAALALASGCSAGPQLPVVTTPINISCSWSVPIGALPERDATVTAPSGTDGTAGIIVSDNDCSVDRSSAQSDAETTGNRARDVQVSPTTSVSAIPGVP